MSGDKTLTDSVHSEPLERPEQSELLRKLDERHAVVYAERMRKLEEQLTPTTLTIAMAQRESEAKRGIPLSCWSFEAAVDDAANACSTVKREQGRRGGSSRKTDALQKIIIQIVREEPAISVSKLLTKLGKLAGGPVIEEIDNLADLKSGEKRVIHFENRSGKDGRAPVSGLKDRLTRARKIIVPGIAPSR